MGLWTRLGNAIFPASESAEQSLPVPYRAMGQSLVISSVEQLEEAMRNGAFGNGSASKSGQLVTSESAMRVAAVFACVRIISGGVANLPLHVMRRMGDKTNQRADETRLWRLLNKRPCKFMRAKQFRRYATAMVLLKGDFFALKVRSAVTGHLTELIPMPWEQVRVELKKDMTVVYKFIRSDGKEIEYKQDNIFHLYALTLNGYSGVTPIKYARETIGGALAMDDHTATVYKNGARVSGIFTTDKRLGSEGRAMIQDSLDEFRQHGAKEGKDMVLEDGLTYERLSMTPQDMQYIEARKMNATDIFMIFGLPPHMASVVEKTTSYGNGVEEQNKGFIQWTLEDYLSMWEEAVNIDLIHNESDLFVTHERKALLRGTLKDQAEYFATMLQNRVMNPNEVRSDVGMNPYDGGDEFLPTPTMASEDPSTNNPGKETGNEPDQE